MITTGLTWTKGDGVAAQEGKKKDQVLGARRKKRGRAVRAKNGLRVGEQSITSG